MKALIDFSVKEQEVLKDLIPAHRYLAELKGLAQSIPNDKILLSNLKLKEAKDSSAIENIITSQDSLYKHQVQPSETNLANKEVNSYAKALERGCKKIQIEKGISLNTILEVQALIEPKRPGFRNIPGKRYKSVQFHFCPLLR